MLPVALGDEAEAVRSLGEAAMTSAPHVTKTTAGLDGMMTGILTGPRMMGEDAIATTVTVTVTATATAIVMTNAHAATVVAVHERHIAAGASRGTRHEALRQLEKSDVESAPALVPETGASVIDRLYVGGTVPVPGAPIILIGMYLVAGVLRLSVVPARGSAKTAGTANAKTVETANGTTAESVSVMAAEIASAVIVESASVVIAESANVVTAESASVTIAGLGGAMTAAIGCGATGREIMTAGTVAENGAADVKNLTAISQVVAVQIVTTRTESATGSPETGAGSAVVRGAVIGVEMTESGAGVQGAGAAAEAAVESVGAEGVGLVGVLNRMYYYQPVDSTWMPL